MKSLLEVVYKGELVLVCVCVCVMCVMCVGVGDESQVVRNAALFAIGQFAEYLQVTSLFLVSSLLLSLLA